MGWLDLCALPSEMLTNIRVEVRVMVPLEVGLQSEPMVNLPDSLGGQLARVAVV